MLEDKVAILFRDSTEMYCQGNYQACLALLSDCLTLESGKSILYSNRSIAYYHLKQLQNSFEDLQLALRANHLNYIAYFNLFSLHFLSGNHKQSFKNLCLCLSSAYTILCRCQPSLQWTDQSIYYSFNNKESLFLKAILVYEKSQLRASLQILKKVYQLQNNFQNRKTILRHIHLIEGQLGVKKSLFQSSHVANSWYVLETGVSYPEPQALEGLLAKMLKEFNEVYRRINDQMEIGHELKENSNSQLSQDEKSQIEEDKQINRITAYNSTAYSRNEPEDQKSAIQSTLHKDLKLLSFIAEKNKNGKDIQKLEGNQTNECLNLFRLGQKLRFFINEARLNLSLDNEKEGNYNIYAILKYKQGENYCQHRTSVIESQKSLKWCEWTDDLVVTQEASELQIKILNKRYDAFKDDLLAEGHVQVNKSGALNIPLFNKQKYNGLITISVEVE